MKTALVTLQSMLGQLIQQTPLLFFSCSATLRWSNIGLPDCGQVWLPVWTLRYCLFSGHISERLNQEIGPHNLRWIVEECEIVRGRHRSRWQRHAHPFAKRFYNCGLAWPDRGWRPHRCMLSYSLVKWYMKVALLARLPFSLLSSLFCPLPSPSRKPCTSFPFPFCPPNLLAEPPHSPFHRY
jgi:hypothetical protein